MGIGTRKMVEEMGWLVVQCEKDIFGEGGLGKNSPWTMAAFIS
jgi:hypothetical protein